MRSEVSGDLLQGPAGVSCAACGAVLPSGRSVEGHGPQCPVAARQKAVEVMGGSPHSLAAALSREAYAAGGAACVEAVADALREMAAALDATAGPRPLRVYVAGGAAERAQCAGWIQRLVREGVEVTHDWTIDPGWDNPSPSPASLAAAAEGDLDGVRRCDVLWLLCPAGKSEGSAAELGAALAWGKRVVVSGPWDAIGRIFPGLAGECYARHEEGFRGVVRAAGVGL